MERASGVASLSEIAFKVDFLEVRKRISGKWDARSDLPPQTDFLPNDTFLYICISEYKV